MTYAEAVDHLYSLGPELAVTPNGPTRKFDLDHMRSLAAELGNPQQSFPAILIAGTNGKGSTAATLASILTAAGYRTGLYTSPHLIRPNERIQLAHPVLPSEYGSAATHNADGPLALTPIADDDFARLYTRVDQACTALIARNALPILPSFFERLTALAFLYFAGDTTPLAPAHPHHFWSLSAEPQPPTTPALPVEIAILEVGLGGRLDATNIVAPLLTLLTDIALDHQEYLGTTIAAITREKCGILRPGVPLITLSQHPEANQVIGEVAAELGVPGINAALYLPPARRNVASSPSPRNNLPLTRDTTSNSANVILSGGDGGFSPSPESKDPEGDRTHNRLSNPSTPELLPLHATRTQGAAHTGSAAPSTLPTPSHSQAEHAALLPPNHYTLPLDDQLLEVDSPLPGHHQQRNLALALAAAFTLRNQYSYDIPNQAIEAGIRNTHWPGRLEFLPPNLLLDVAHNPAGAWTLRAAIAALPPETPRTLIFSCLRDKSLEEMTRILFPLFDASDTDPLRRHDHILLAPIASPRAAAVDDLLAAAHKLQIPAHAAPHLAAALHQAQQITPPGGLILATGSVYLVGEIRALALAAQATQEPAHA